MQSSVRMHLVAFSLSCNVIREQDTWGMLRGFMQCRVRNTPCTDLSSPSATKSRCERASPLTSPQAPWQCRHTAPLLCKLRCSGTCCWPWTAESLHKTQMLCLSRCLWRKPWITALLCSGRLAPSHPQQGKLQLRFPAADSLEYQHCPTLGLAPCAAPLPTPTLNFHFVKLLSQPGLRIYRTQKEQFSECPDPPYL